MSVRLIRNPLKGLEVAFSQRLMLGRFLSTRVLDSLATDSRALCWAVTRWLTDNTVDLRWRFDWLKNQTAIRLTCDQALSARFDQRSDRGLHATMETVGQGCLGEFVKQPVLDDDDDN